MFAAVTGLIAGIIHVWSGPDHLAAIAPLAVRSPRRAWAPGARWGMGHSAGVAVIGLLSLWLRDLLPVKMLSNWGERCVGIMLIMLMLRSVSVPCTDSPAVPTSWESCLRWRSPPGWSPSLTWRPSRSAP